MDTFNPATPPDYDGNSIDETPRSITVQFGDGYKQRAPDGLNPNNATASFTWTNIPVDQMNYIVGFYMSHIASTFLWSAPGDSGGNGKWAFVKLKKTNSNYNLYTVSIDLERSFELA